MSVIEIVKVIIILYNLNTSIIFVCAICCYFFNNNADRDGGAVYWDGNGGTISGSSFADNNAARNGGAVYWSGFIEIYDCDNPNEDIKNCISEKHGGVLGSDFTGNTAVLGGAIFTNGNNFVIDEAYFNNNNATSGSAIYKTKEAKGCNILNTLFERNQAQSTEIFIEVINNETFAPHDVTVNVYLVARDNIANAIWNDGTRSTIMLKNITCEFSYDDSVGRELKTFNENELREPDNEYESEDFIWQSLHDWSVEDAQLIDIIIRNQTGVIYEISGGKIKKGEKNQLRALPDDSDLIVTRTDGAIHIQLDSLPAGEYSVEAKHYGDAYYTEIENSDTFVLYDLNVRKTTEDVLVMIGQTVTYNITVINDADEPIESINITEDYPEELDLLSYQTKWFGVDAPDNWKWERYDGTNRFHITNGNSYMSSFIPEGGTVVLILVFKAIEKGTFKNTAKVESYSTLPVVVTSQETTVADVVLNVTKTANVTVTANNTLVNYTIVVNNTGLIDVTEVNIVDVLPGNLTYAGKWGIIDANGADVTNTTLANGVEWIISNITADKSVSLWIEVRAVGFGNLTNNVTVYSSENKTPVKDNETVHVVPANVSIVKTANVTNVSVGDLVEFTLNVTNTGLIEATNITVTDLLDSAFEVQTIGNETYLKYNDTERIVWNIPSLNVGNSTFVTVVVKVTREGTFNNTAVVKTPETNETNSTVNVTAERIPTHTTVSNVTTYPDTDVDIFVNVTADDGKPVNGNVTVILPDGSNRTVLIVNGSGNTTWHVPANYTPGDYPDIAVFDGRDDYLPSNGTGIITVLPIPTHTTVGNVTTYPGRNVTVPINVTADDNKPVNGNVTITFPDGSNQTVEIINGTGNATWFVPEDYAPGNYPDNAAFPGNETYLPSNGTGNIEVIKVPTHVNIGNVTGYPGEEVTIPINMTADDGIPFNGNVTVKLPDGSNQTVEIINGTGNITWNIPDDYTPDIYNDTVEFGGDVIYLPSNNTGIIEVVKIPTHITVGNVTTFAGREVTIPINVTADDGKPFTGNVTITLPDGSTKVVEIINGTGTTTWFVPSDYTPDIYPDTVRFPGDNKYLPSEGKGTITVIKIPVDIIVGNVTAHPGDDVTIPIEVIPRDGSLFNGNVTVELPDGSKKVVEIVNNKGSVDWTIPDNYKGDYLVKVSSNETEVYYPANGIGIITVIVDNHTAENDTVTPNKDIAKNTLARHETGNPIMVLLVVLALLGINIKRRK